MYPVVFANGVIEFPSVPLGVVLQVANELLVGVIIGFVAVLAFATFQVAGQFIDLSIGFSMVNVIDPFLGEDAPLMGQFKNMLALMVLLAVDGHHQFFRALITSFQVAPVTKPILSANLLEYIFRIGGDLFLVGLRIALPVVATIFIVDFVFGFIARTVPQMNIFILGFPVKILIGFLLIFLTIPFLVQLIGEVIQMMNHQIFDVLKILKQTP
jgi:flagellar biosynthetic protein FliR